MLFVVPDTDREWVLNAVGRAAVRGALVPAPRFWTASHEELVARGAAGGGVGARSRRRESSVTLPEIETVGVPEVPPSAR